MKSYCLGFLFSEFDHVMLIEKNKPEWQKGLLNGVGGKIEDGEDAMAAMIREFKEETGIEFAEWEERAVLKGPGWIIFVYAGFWKDQPPHPHIVATGDEQAKWYPFEELTDLPIITNLRYLIPLMRWGKNSSLNGIVQLHYDK